jgi:threonine aldolase
MLQYMFNAEVGDDVYRQDPTVIALETRTAAIRWKQVCFPSGIMANQTAIKVHTRRAINRRQVCTCLSL